LPESVKLLRVVGTPSVEAEIAITGGKAGIEVLMQTPLDFLNIFRFELRASGICFAITSGMACVH